jgi:hypothetical protein
LAVLFPFAVFTFHFPSLTSLSQTRKALLVCLHIIYLSVNLSIRAQLLAPALVRRRVLRLVPLAAVRRHLAPATLDVYVCWLLALRIVADPSQLVAQTLVLIQVLHGVVLAAVYRHSAPGTLLESLVELQVRGARLARR